ncbi:MAG: DUF1016 N-terminal domain-containing protein, partial [Planctomycetota bacterium]
MKREIGPVRTVLSVYGRIRQILDSAKSTIARSVNTTQVVANWLIGREIVEEEQKGAWRAEYGKSVLDELSRRLTNEYGNGYSVDNLDELAKSSIACPMRPGKVVPVVSRTVHASSCSCGACPRLRMGDRKGR